MRFIQKIKRTTKGILSILAAFALMILTALVLIVVYGIAIIAPIFLIAFSIMLSMKLFYYWGIL